MAGTWGKARHAPGLTSSASENGALSVLSCTSGYCAAGGADSVTYSAYPGLFFSGAVVASLAERGPTATSLKLSAAKVGYGHEQTAKLAVAVTSHGAGHLAGTVTIMAGKTTVCVLTLKSGKGACALSSARFRPGSYHLIARYLGSALYRGSASAAKTLTIAK